MHSDAFATDRFPRATAYNPAWIRAGVSGGANPLWLTEWLSESLDLQPGMRVLDLGCGRALSSIFLHREFGVRVWAADLWFDVSENQQRVQDAGAGDGVFPLHAEAHSLPFPRESFDVVVSIDSFMYYGTDDLYLSYLAGFLKPGGQIGIAGSGLVQEIHDDVPPHLQAWWTPELCCLHSAAWWRRHWARSGLLEIETSDTLAEGWRFWRDWLCAIAPDNRSEIETLETDAGRVLGYVRTVGRRRMDAQIPEPVDRVPMHYEKTPLLRTR